MPTISVKTFITFMVVGIAVPINSRAQQNSRQKGIDAETVAAFEKLGATYGGWKRTDKRAATRISNSYFGFQAGTFAAEEGLPGFRLDRVKPGRLRNLPVVSVAFGIDRGELSDDGDLEELGKQAHLTYLEIRGFGITDAGLAALKSLKQLSNLTLSVPAITDGGVKELTTIVSLSELHLGADYTDVGLSELAKLKQLTRLSLHGKQRVIGISLTELEGLQCLSVSGELANDFGLFAISQIPNLRELTLAASKTRDQITAEGLDELRKMSNLSALKIDGLNIDVDDAGLEALSRLSNLSSLYFRCADVSVAAMSNLHRLKKLSLLWIRDLPATDAMLAEIKSLKSEQPALELHVDFRVVTDDALRRLSTNGLLHCIGAAAFGRDTPIPTKSEEVVVLWLAESQITDRGLKEIREFRNLQKLYLDGTEVTDVGLKEIASFSKLTALYLRNTKVTNRGLAELKRSLPNCRIHL